MTYLDAPRRNRTYNLVYANSPRFARNGGFAAFLRASLAPEIPEPSPKATPDRQRNGNRRAGVR